LPWEKIPRRAPGPGFPTGSPGIPPNELPAATIEFKYDGLSRLVERKVTRGIDPPEVEGYQWDGWKLIMIAKLNTDGTYHSRKWSCVWRPDVGSSLYARSDWMRAGGVGGLAWLQTGAVQSYSYGTGSAEVHVPLADHMGNVRHYYQFKASGKTVTGQLVASYEYDAFGREVRAWGTNTPATSQPPGLPANRPWADLLPFHYSSKLRDADSGFNYYGYRFYDPGAGRWLNRDPIGEEGGMNLYGFVNNDPLNLLDYLGLNTCHIWVYLPKDRSNLGTMYVYDHGNRLVYTAPVRGAGTKKNPLKENGPTPTGDYTGTPLSGPMGNEGANGPYGSNPPMRLTGHPYSNQPALGGQAYIAGRPGLLIHGGRQNRAQQTQVKVKLWDIRKRKWIEQTVNRPSNTFGCLRLDESLASDFIGTINSESCCTEWNVHVREGVPPANPSKAPTGS